MRYWLLTTEFPPFSGGGISTYCGITARFLAEAGHEVCVFVYRQFAGEAHQKSKGVTIVPVDLQHSPNADVASYETRLSYSFAIAVKSRITEFNETPDVIEAQDYLGIAYYLTQMKNIGDALLLNVPIVLTLHSPAFVYLDYNQVPYYKFPHYWTCEMEKHAIAAADLLISPSHFMVDEIQRYMSVDLSKTHILPNPYPMSSEANEPENAAVDTIVYYGKLSPQKGSFELLRDMKNLWDDGFNHPLHVIGDGGIVFYPYMQTMAQVIERQYEKYIKNGLLFLHEKIEPDDITNSLLRAKVVLVPSIVDNLPYVVIESMARGKVVLASRHGGQAEIIEDEVTGFLFDHNVAGDFGKKLRRIVNMDDQEISDIGKRAAKAVSDRYDAKKIVDAKLNLLQRYFKGHATADNFPFLFQEPYSSSATEPKKKPGVLTVVVPFFNMGNWVEECVESILASSYKEIEVLIVDDGSSDAGSLGKISAMKLHERITVVHKTNQGLAATRNYGALAAEGEFLAFLDPDDRVDSRYYEKCILVLQRKKNVHFVGSWVRYFGDSSREWLAFTPQPPYCLYHNPVNSSGLVYNRQSFIQMGMNDKRLVYGFEDYDSVLQMMKGGCNGVVVPEFLFFYQVRENSMFRRINQPQALYALNIISSNHRDYFSKFSEALLNLTNANGPGYLVDNPAHETRVDIRNVHASRFMRGTKSIVKKNKYLKRIALAMMKMLK